MADKWTKAVVRIPGGAMLPSYAARGHVSWEEAVAGLVARAEQSIQVGEQTLEAVRAGRVEVFQQTNLWRAMNRRQVFPAAGAGGEGIDSVSETEKFDDDAAGADAQDDNASAEPEAGPEADEDSE